MSLFALPGVSATDKVPGHLSQNLFGQGKSSGTRPWYVVCTGNKTSGGTMVADRDVEVVYSEDEVATKVGIRSECAQQAREALASGALVVLAPVAEAAGAVAATLVLNCEALGTGTGSVGVLLGDETVSFVVDVASQQNTMTAAAAAINAVPTLFCVATLGGATEYDVTITVSSAGARGNDWLAKLDMSAAPTGCIMTLGPTQDPDAIKTSIATVAVAASYSGATLTGVLGNPGPAIISPPRQCTATLSSSPGSYTNGSTITFTGLNAAGGALVEAVTITGTGGGIMLTTVGYFASVSQIDIQAQVNTSGAFQFGVYSRAERTAAGWTRFYGGTGTDNVTAVLDLLESAEYRRIAAAQNDATNAARFETHVDAEAGPLVAHSEQVIFGHNGTSAAAVSLAQTTLNAYRCAVYPRRNSRKHPCQIAAKVAANRAVLEAQNAWERFDGKWNDQGAKLWTDVPAEFADEWTHPEMVALLDAGCSPLHDFGGTTCIVRSVTSHSLNGTNPDWRCLDTAWVTVAEQVRDDVDALATTEAEQNPGVGPDLPDGQPQIEGVSTPKVWGATVNSYLKGREKQGWVKDVDANPPVTEYDDVTDANYTIVPVVVRPHLHQIFTSVRQIAG